MDKKDKEGLTEESSIKIDYENIDIASVMDQIKEKIAKQPRKPPQEEPPKEMQDMTYPAPLPMEPREEEKAFGYKKKIKKILLKIMRPFAPLIKLLVLPVHEEVMETVRNLHQTNKRLDALNAKLERDLSEAMAHADRRLNQTNQRLDIAYSDLARTMEYVKLLHNLSHNIVVELSKLKVEEETLKSKTRVMEKDFEFLGRREKALEKRVFK